MTTESGAVEAMARDLAKAAFDSYHLIGVTASVIERDLYVDKRWHDFEAEARAMLTAAKGERG